MAIRQHAGQSEQAPRISSPTVENILNGRSKITFLQNGSETRIVDGHKYFGSFYMYKLNVPSPSMATDEEGTWETFLTVWSPDQMSKKEYTELPGMQITISTGKGEMLISSDPKTIEGIYSEISRQMNEQRSL